MKRYIAITLMTALGFSGCTNSLSSLNNSKPTTTANSYTQSHIAYDTAPEHKIIAFRKAQRRVGLLTHNNPNYKSFKPVLTSEESKIWFNNQMYLLWDRQITKEQYIAQGVAKLPAYRYEFTFIANNF